MPWRMNELEKLEMVQNKVGRIALGANKYVVVETIRGDVGWITFEESYESCTESSSEPLPSFFVQAPLPLFVID